MSRWRGGGVDIHTVQTTESETVHGWWQRARRVVEVCLDGVREVAGAISPGSKTKQGRLGEPAQGQCSAASARYAELRFCA